MDGNKNLDMIAAHLSVPCELSIDACDIARAMRIESAWPTNSPQMAIILSMFNEVSPQLIVLAMVEAASNRKNLSKLYRASLEAGFSRSSEWDRFVEIYG